MMIRFRKRVALGALLGTALGAGLVATPYYGLDDADTALVAVDRAHGVDLSPEVIWVLALGSDARPSEKIVRSRADAIHLIGMNQRTGSAVDIGIPRDSWVAIPGAGHNRINAALYFGGPQAMAKAVGGLVGIEPDYVFVSGFQGVINMVDGIGGITVNSKYAFSDKHLRPQGFVKGENRLKGKGAEAFARTRKSLPSGDFDRSANQTEVIRAIQREVAARADEPGFLAHGVWLVMKNLKTDLSPAELYRFAEAMTHVDQSRITGCVLSGSFGNINGASIIHPNVAQARRWGNDARKDAFIEKC